MAIQQLPAWIGSQAVAETGQQWMSAARPIVFLPPTGWMSEMAGRSRWNCVLIVGRNSHSVIWGYSESYFGGIENNSGRYIEVLAATNEDWDQGVDRGLYISGADGNVSRIDCTLEGFNGNEVIQLPFHGTHGTSGNRLYFQNNRLDIFDWLVAREGQRINVLLQYY